MDKLLSVIVPVYNAEKYLERCIDSILCQKYGNLEIIIIDDGSNDNSGWVCDEYAKKDLRIQVYHSENKGLASARKFGVSMAKGSLITFVDSDDWIEEDMYCEMMEEYKKYASDIISSGLIFDNGTKQSVEHDAFAKGLYDADMIENEIIPVMMYHPSFHKRAITSTVCNKIFKKQLLADAIKRLDIELTYGEDAAITYMCVAKADMIVFTEKAWYHYCTHSDSMVTSFCMESLQKIKRFEDYMALTFKELGIWMQMWYQLKQYTKLFLLPAVEAVYGVELSMPQFSFPFHLIEKGSRIVIYGAGTVGRAYYRDFAEKNFGKITGWVDKNYRIMVEKGYYVRSPEFVKDMEFDYIIIAIDGESTAHNVASYLEEMKIPKNKIVWKKPIKNEG